MTTRPDYERDARHVPEREKRQIRALIKGFGQIVGAGDWKYLVAGTDLGAKKYPYSIEGATALFRAAMLSPGTRQG